MTILTAILLDAVLAPVGGANNLAELLKQVKLHPDRWLTLTVEWHEGKWQTQIEVENGGLRRQ
jgi:hypothetical protein